MREQDWDIRSRGDTCEACERTFNDREEFFSQLTFGEEGYKRGDYCLACWEKTSHEGALSIWRSEFRLPPPPPEEPLKKENAESLLRKLIETEDPESLNTIFILAVMLERRRILEEKDVKFRDDGVKVRVYEHKKTQEVFMIPDPQLRLDQLEQVQEEVVLMLGGKPPSREEPEEGDAEEASDEETETSPHPSPHNE